MAFEDVAFSEGDFEKRLFERRKNSEKVNEFCTCLRAVFDKH